MAQTFYGEEYYRQVKDFVESFDDKTFSKDTIAEQLAENNKDLTGETVVLSEERKKFWSDGAERNLKRLANEGVLIDNGDGTYTKK
ncbi:hypothetical protein [Priestia megaterium]|uniref:hypothetical protein n=1 Tax=Priestia megaterium TaxID=1404 RepID=UPI002ACDB2F4|nr:hypothetical protein [Priestia megaterium]